MPDILKLDHEGIMALAPADVDRPLTVEEVLHIAISLGAFWTYNYEALKAGKPGLHALLKSERHSDGFFVSRILLEPGNILDIMAAQMVLKLTPSLIGFPDYVIGIPDGATKLGAKVAELLDANVGMMRKEDGHLVLDTRLAPFDTILLVEDFCTRGTGFTEAVQRILARHPDADIIPFNPVIINRGGLETITVDGVDIVRVLPIAERRIQDWEPSECPLCQAGSRAIKPKVSEESWYEITHSQL